MLVAQLMKKVAIQAQTLGAQAEHIAALQQFAHVAAPGDASAVDKNVLIKHLEKRVGELHRENERLKQQLAEAQKSHPAAKQPSGSFQTKLISSLKEELETLKAYLKSYQGQVQAAKATEEALRQKIADMQDIVRAAAATAAIPGPTGAAAAGAKRGTGSDANVAAAFLRLQEEVAAARAERDALQRAVGRGRDGDAPTDPPTHPHSTSAATGTAAATAAAATAAAAAAGAEVESLRQRLGEAEAELRRLGGPEGPLARVQVPVITLPI
jgi:hypothetical protein